MAKTKIEQAEESVQRRHKKGLIQYCIERTDEDVTLSEIAREVGLNRTHLERYLMNSGYRLRRRLEPIHPVPLT